jgi:hypothetical protein
MRDVVAVYSNKKCGTSILIDPFGLLTASHYLHLTACYQHEADTRIHLAKRFFEMFYIVMNIINRYCLAL